MAEPSGWPFKTCLCFNGRNPSIERSTCSSQMADSCAITLEQICYPLLQSEAANALLCLDVLQSIADHHGHNQQQFWPLDKSISQAARLISFSLHLPVHQLLGHTERAGQCMSAAMDLVKQSPQRGGAKRQGGLQNGLKNGAKERGDDQLLLPMQPGDLGICHTLLRCGVYQFCQVASCFW